METLPANEVIASLINEFKSGYITTIYGNAASGKTTTCLMAVIEAAKKGWKTVYVDNENSFDTDRLKQIYGDNVDKVLENLFLIKPKSFREQNSIIANLPKLCNNGKIKLIVIDTIGIHYRLAVKEDLKIINTQMIIQMNLLEKLAKEQDKIILLTNQAGSKFTPIEDKEDKFEGIKMVGGAIMENSSKCIIELHKKDKRRFATLIKYKTEDNIAMIENVGRPTEFVIKEKGLFLS
jgi:DNA repair protein RadB